MAPKKKKVSAEERKIQKRNAEKLRYAKLKSDPVKAEEMRIKNVEKKRKRKEEGKDEPISAMTQREKRAQRKRWRESSKNYRLRKKNEIQDMEEEEAAGVMGIAGPSSQLQANPVSHQILSGEKRRRRNRDECNKLRTEITALRKKMDCMTKKYERARQICKGNIPADFRSPNTKGNNVLALNDQEAVRRKLLFGETLAQRLKDNGKNTKSTSAKRDYSRANIGDAKLLKKIIVSKMAAVEPVDIDGNLQTLQQFGSVESEGALPGTVTEETGNLIRDVQYIKRERLDVGEEEINVIAPSVLEADPLGSSTVSDGPSADVSLTTASSSGSPLEMGCASEGTIQIKEEWPRTDVVVGNGMSDVLPDSADRLAIKQEPAESETAAHTGLPIETGGGPGATMHIKEEWLECVIEEETSDVTSAAVDDSSGDCLAIREESASPAAAELETFKDGFVKDQLRSNVNRLNDGFVNASAVTDAERAGTDETESTTFSCYLCEYKCDSKWMLDLHTKNHWEKPYACALCNYCCKRLDGLVVHMRTHTGEKLYVCDVCNLSCRRLHDLTRHKMTHNGEKGHVCHVCHYSFATANYLAVHVRRIHNGEKPYKCTVCNYVCNTAGNLTIHKRIHIGDKLFFCRICNYSCMRAGYLAKHERTCHR